MTPKNKTFSIPISFCVGILFAGCLTYFMSYFYVFTTNFEAKKYETKLISLGKESLISGDVPVGSLLLYDDKIIGQGNNDVVRNNNPSGHAEINALKNCFESIGLKQFLKLNKQKLTLLSTYEPCEMCKGAIKEYGIKNVVFSFSKRKKDKYNNFKNELKYYINLRQMTNRRLQYDLFLKHSKFDSIAYPY